MDKFEDRMQNQLREAYVIMSEQEQAQKNGLTPDLSQLRIALRKLHRAWNPIYARFLYQQESEAEDE